MALQRPKGTQDHLPDGSPKLRLDTQARAFAHVAHVAGRVLERAGAAFIETPIFEDAELVKRGVGGSTDIVRKEMFTVFYAGDHGGYVLRPEGTAGLVRAYLENGLKQLPPPLKLWTHGPMFRAENVQKGRLRQFHQVDYEVLGSTDALVDAEAILLMVEVVRALGLRGVQVKLGSIGDPEDRERYNEYLQALFTPHQDALSDDSKDRLTRNPMRILDSKSRGDQDLIAELKVKPMLDFLGADAAAHFRQVQAYLTAWGVEYEIDPSIVRGLDYYRRTAWELHHAHIGAKSALGGGGRYDGLSAQLGGPEVPGIGWAFGVERILLAMEDEGIKSPATPRLDFYVSSIDEKYTLQSTKITNLIRSLGNRSCEFAYRPKSVKQALRDAERKNARLLILIGDEEYLGNYVTIKDMGTGKQIPVDLSIFVSLLNKNIPNSVKKIINSIERIVDIQYDESIASMRKILASNTRFKDSKIDLRVIFPGLLETEYRKLSKEKTRAMSNKINIRPHSFNWQNLHEGDRYI